MTFTRAEITADYSSTVPGHVAALKAFVTHSIRFQNRESFRLCQSNKLFTILKHMVFGLHTTRARPITCSVVDSSCVGVAVVASLIVVLRIGVVVLSVREAESLCRAVGVVHSSPFIALIIIAPIVRVALVNGDRCLIVGVGWRRRGVVLRRGSVG